MHQKSARLRHNEHATGRAKMLAHLGMLAFALIIAGSYSFGALAAKHMQPAALLVLRYVATTLLMAVLCFGVMKMPRRLPLQPLRFVVLGCLMGIYMLTLFIALRLTTPIATGAVFTVMPLLSAGFAWLLIRQRTRVDVLASLVIAAVGAVWVIFRGDLDALLAFDLGRGELIFFVGVICHAVYVPLIRKFDRGEHPLLFNLWAGAGTLLFMLVPGFPDLLAVDWGSVPPVVWSAVAYLSVVATAIALLLLQFASLRLPAPKVLAYGYLTPTFVIIIEGLLGHGWATPSVFIGAAITACGLALMITLKD